MKKILLSAVSVCIANVANASVNLDSAGKVKAYGDFRLRMEVEEKSAPKQEDQERERARLRARLGVKFKPNDEWGANIRLATNSDQGVSANQTFDTDSPEKNTEFGIDRAFVQYAPQQVSGLALTAGKMHMPHDSNSGQFWDSDQPIDGFSAAYIYREKSRGSAKFTFTHGILNEGNFANDDDLFHAQVSYIAPVIKDIKISGSISATHLNVDDTYRSTEVLGLSARADYGASRFAFDLYDSNADDNHFGLILQGRYKINSDFGVRLYYYYVEAFSMPADGQYSNSDFPTPGSYGITNFEGTRLQLDYQVAKNTSLDLRLFSLEQIKSTNTIASELGFGNWDNATGFKDAIAPDEDKVRLQANLVVNF